VEEVKTAKSGLFFLISLRSNATSSTGKETKEMKKSHLKNSYSSNGK
jgi:hypothetical protein